MPHYVAKPTKSSLKYHIFSTVVDAPITKKMYRKDMEAYLAENGYETWLDSTPWVEASPEDYNPNTDIGRQIIENTNEYTYWNGSFWFVLEEDGYFI